MRLKLLCVLLLLGFWGCSAPPLTRPPDGVASVSSPLALSPDGKTLWVVNPDADSVTPLDTHALTPGLPIVVGREPWAVAVTPSGLVVVMNRLDGSLTLLEGDRRTDVPIGPEPGGLALSPSGRTAYVSVSSADEVAVVNLAAGKVVDRLPVGRMPWAVAVTDDGDTDDHDETIIVSHRLARLRPGAREATNDGKEGWLTLLTTDGTRREVVIAPYDFGYPNALEGLAVLGDTVLVTHLLNKPELPRDFENTVSGALSAVSLAAGRELRGRRLHVNDKDFSTPVNFPRAVALSPEGDTAYLALAGSNAVMVIDLAEPAQAKLRGFLPTGSNPRGIVLDPAGNRAFVMNYLSRDVSVLDLTAGKVGSEIARITVVDETLEPTLLQGKRLFNNASDPRLSHLGWISCASCHLDGGVDGSTWLTPDGPRQTQPLWNLAGTEPLHASATRDEVQDFEHDIEGVMGGIGLAPAPAAPELGEPNGARSADLDALAAYVLRGIRVPKPPQGDEGEIARGRTVFAEAGCATCHGGASWTISSLPGEVGTLAPNGEREVLAVLRDVGTFNSETDVLGKHGFDVPSLLGLHATAPYLHDGSKATLEALLADTEHVGSTLTLEQIASLSAFLNSIDAQTVPFDSDQPVAE